jgi:hypothetical protein
MRGRLLRRRYYSQTARQFETEKVDQCNLKLFSSENKGASSVEPHTQNSGYKYRQACAKEPVDGTFNDSLLKLQYAYVSRLSFPFLPRDDEALRQSVTMQFCKGVEL